MDSTPYTGKLKDRTPETLETLRQADAFKAMAQDESVAPELRETYRQMALLRYDMVMVPHYEPGAVNEPR